MIKIINNVNVVLLHYSYIIGKCEKTTHLILNTNFLKLSIFYLILIKYKVLFY